MRTGKILICPYTNILTDMASCSKSPPPSLPAAHPRAKESETVGGGEEGEGVERVLGEGGIGTAESMRRKNRMNNRGIETQ